MGRSDRLRETLEDGQVWLESRALTAANPLFFALRRRLAFRRRGYAESPRSDARPAPEVAAWMGSPRALDVSTRFELGDFRERLSPATYATVHQFADLLDAIFDQVRALGMAIAPAGPDDTPHTGGPGEATGDGGPPLRALDIGSKNFDAAPAIHRVLRRETGGLRPICLTGIEIDAHRVYRSLHSRKDVADYYLSLITEPEAPHRFLAADYLGHADRYHVVTWFKPFLTPYAHLRWGLPARLLRPEAMTRHLLSGLVEGGVAIIVNQNHHEAKIQRDLLNAAGASFHSLTLAEVSRRTDEPAHVHLVRASRDTETATGSA